MRFLLLISFFIVSNGLWSYEQDFICDVPYTFYPDKEKRYVLQFGEQTINDVGTTPEGIPFVYKAKIELAFFYINPQLTFARSTSGKGRTKFTDSEILINIMNRKVTINRYTGEMYAWLDNLNRNCETVSDSETKRAIRELEELSEKLKEKKYSEEQGKLKKRKF
tara:strand:- start:131 stop:625 length:495 start_codon:yes stop_codon:yes gene_type:complete